jgi:hypothetical protein
MAALQLHAAAVSPWKILDRTSIAWRAGATPYEVLLEESVPPRDSDPDHRIRIRVPGRPDFVIVDGRGPGPYLAVREALKFGDHRLISSTLPDSARVLPLPLRGPGGTAVVAVFGWAYASDPEELTLIGFDPKGYPYKLFRGEFALQTVADLDGDGMPEVVGRPTIPQAYGKCSATYDPYAVYRAGGGKLRYDLALSRRYNQAHYVWAGPHMSEKIEVEECAPGKYHLLRHE